MNMKNYGLYRLNGCPTGNLNGAGAQLLRIPDSNGLSVSIGCLHPRILEKESVQSVKSVVKQ